MKVRALETCWRPRHKYLDPRTGKIRLRSGKVYKGDVFEWDFELMGKELPKNIVPVNDPRAAKVDEELEAEKRGQPPTTIPGQAPKIGRRVGERLPLPADDSVTEVVVQTPPEEDENPPVETQE
jgi:hypothetical protein